MDFNKFKIAKLGDGFIFRYDDNELLIKTGDMTAMYSVNQNGHLTLSFDEKDDSYQTLSNLDNYLKEWIYRYNGGEYVPMVYKHMRKVDGEFIESDDNRMCLKTKVKLRGDNYGIVIETPDSKIKNPNALDIDNYISRGVKIRGLVRVSGMGFYDGKYHIRPTLVKAKTLTRDYDLELDEVTDNFEAIEL